MKDKKYDIKRSPHYLLGKIEGFAFRLKDEQKKELLSMCDELSESLKVSHKEF